METKGLLKRIDERLAATGLTENAASEAAGLTRDAIRNIRRGKSKNPTMRTVAKLAASLHCDAKWLATGEGDFDLTAQTDEEAELLERFRSMSDEQRAGAIGMIRLINDSDARKVDS